MAEYYPNEINRECEYHDPKICNPNNYWVGCTKKSFRDAGECHHFRDFKLEEYIKLKKSNESSKHSDTIK